MLWNDSTEVVKCLNASSLVRVIVSACIPEIVVITTWSSSDAVDARLICRSKIQTDADSA